jgi:hypothetical protein
VYAGLDDASQTFAWLKKAQDARDERMVMINVDLKLDTLRSDPLFTDLLRNLGLAKAELSVARSDSRFRLAALTGRTASR